MSFRSVNPRLLLEIVYLYVLSVQKIYLKVCLLVALLKLFLTVHCYECSEWQSRKPKLVLLPRFEGGWMG